MSQKYLPTSPVGTPESPEKAGSGSKPQVQPHSLDFTQSHQIILAMYWDLNAIWQLQQIVAEDPSNEGVELYRKHCEANRSFLDHAVCQKHAEIFQQKEHPNVNRCRFFILEHGWAFFAMCAQAEAFREAYHRIETFAWDKLRKLITTNKRSIEIYVQSRKIDWRGPLLNYLQWDFPDILKATAPMLDIGKEHPHHIVQNLDGTLKRPIYQEKAQTNINSMINYKPLRKGQKHPLERPRKLGPCMACVCKEACACHDLGGSPSCKKCNCPKVCRCSNPVWVRCFNCGSREFCQCRVEAMAGGLIELREYSLKGTGVRALTNFKAGDILGEYLGEVFPAHEQPKDTVYSLSQMGFHGLSRVAKQETVAIITSAHLGNWTRFINHHCEANCTFRGVMVGGRVTTIVEVTRDILIFEEITVDYGEEYWLNRRCLCGSKKCYSRRKLRQHAY